MNKFSYIFLLLVVFPLEFITGQDEVFIPYRNGQKWGFADTNKNIIILPIFDNVFNYHNDFFIVQNSGKVGVVNFENKIIVDIKFDRIQFNDNGILAYKNHEVNSFSYDGEFLSKYDLNLQQTLSIESDNQSIKSSELTNLKDNEIEKYEAWQKFKSKSIKNHTINIPDSIREQEKPNFNTFYSFSKSKARDKYHLVLKKMILSVNPKIIEYDTLRDKEYYNIELISSSGYYQKHDSIYFHINKFRFNNWALVTNNQRKQGIINGINRMDIPCEYDSIKPKFIAFLGEIPLFIVKKKGKWGIINLKNDIIVNFEYDEIHIDDPNSKTRFRIDPDHPFVVEKNKRYGLINLKNEIIVDFKYDEIYKEQNVFIIENKNKFGMFSLSKNLFIPAIFEWKIKTVLTNLNHSGFPLIKIFDNNKFKGYADLKGQLYFEN